MSDYRSAVDAQNLRDFGPGAGLESLQRLAQMLQQKQQHEQTQQDELAKMAYQKQLAQEAQESNIQRAKQLKDELDAGGKGKAYKVGLTSGGGVDISENERDQLMDLLRMEQLSNQRQDKRNKAVQDLEDRSTKAGTAQILPALQRAEKSIPGVLEGKAKLKSVGGAKTLAPNIAVPALERFGILPKGSAEERAALQELSNTKIYDSSGKQINESEMRRIKEAMGLRGVFSPDVINDALKQVGTTALQKQKQVTAGATPEAVQTFRSRGGLAGANTLQELLGIPGEGQQAQPQQGPQRTVIKTEVSPSTGKKRITYSDGTQEIQ